MDIPEENFVLFEQVEVRTPVPLDKRLKNESF